VQDRATKEPYKPSIIVAKLVHERAISLELLRTTGPILIYYSQGSATGAAIS
jgi:hypothetical protein